LYDEFNGSSLDTSLWTFDNNSTGGAYTVDGGLLTVYSVLCRKQLFLAR
jgi:hypothetical protein